MFTLLFFLLVLVWLASWGVPAYYPAYAARYSGYPLWGNSSHILLGFIAIMLLLWSLGYAQS
jgi:uncharacterized membrane protein YhdT